MDTTIHSPPPPTVKEKPEPSRLHPEVLKKIDAQAENFEGMFMAQMLQFMWQGVDAGEFSGGTGESTWRGMMIEEYGKISSQAGNLGIADSVKAEMIKAQERYLPPELDEPKPVITKLDGEAL